jgi:hypothetical protein
VSATEQTRGGPMTIDEAIELCEELIESDSARTGSYQ